MTCILLKSYNRKQTNEGIDKKSHEDNGELVDSNLQSDKIEKYYLLVQCQVNQVK